jgi:outer membrane protein assembly factor BamB
MTQTAANQNRVSNNVKALPRSAALLAFLVFLVGCSTQPPLEIKGVVFGRDVVAVRLTRATSIEIVSLHEDQKEIVRRTIQETGELFFLDWCWEPGKTYSVQVTPAGGRTPVTVRYRSPEKPSPIIVGSVELEGDVEPRGIRDSAYLGGRVAVSPDGTYAVVGTEKSRLRLFRMADGRQLWSRRIGEGRILAVAFASQGRRLLVGEQSRDAFITCFDTQSGEELWKHRTADDVGEIEQGDPRARWPVIAGVAVVETENGGPGARCFVAAKRQYEVQSSLVATSKIYSFDVESGAVLWTFPNEGAMDASPSMLATDARGRTVLFNNWKKGKVSDKALYGLSGETGRELWGFEMEQLYPGRDYLIWHGFGISRDGSRVVVFSQDGRGFLLDHASLLESSGRTGVIWQKEISSPVLVNGMRLIGQGSTAHVNDQYIVFSTGSTIVQQASNAKTFIEHPNGNSLFIYDLEGRLLWTHKPGGLCYDIPLSADGRYVILGAAHGKAETDTAGHGVYVFDNSRSGSASDRLAWFLNTEGICLSAAASSDGKHIAALEYPLDMDPRSEIEDVRGKHRLYFLR